MSKDDQTTRDIETLRGWIDAAQPGGVVFFGGAGVSTESGIPDFRSPSGLYSAQSARRYDYPPEVMVSRSFFDAHPREFFDFYFDRMVFRDAQPQRLPPQACRAGSARHRQRGHHAEHRRAAPGRRLASACWSCTAACTATTARTAMPPFSLDEATALHSSSTLTACRAARTATAS